MNKFAVLAPLALFGLSIAASAQVEDVNPLFERGWTEGRRWSSRYEDQKGPIYYRPTQRYYGSGYTISYRYVPVYKSDVGPGKISTGSSNFRTEAFAIQPDDVPAWKAGSPRLVVNDPKSSAPRAAITSIVRKKTTTTRTTTKSTGETPAIIDGAAPAKP